MTVTNAPATATKTVRVKYVHTRVMQVREMIMEYEGDVDIDRIEEIIRFDEDGAFYTNPGFVMDMHPWMRNGLVSVNINDSINPDDDEEVEHWGWINGRDDVEMNELEIEG